MSKEREGRAGDGLYRKRGYWYFTVVDWTGKRHAISTGTKVYREALKIKSDYLNNLANGAINAANSGRMLFRDAAPAWKDRAVIGLQPGTVSNYTHQLDNAIAIIGDLPIGKISANTLRHYQVLRTNDGIGPAYINQETSRIASVLKEHHLWDKIRPDFKRLKVPESIGRSLADEETEQFLSGIQKNELPAYVRPVMVIFYATGLRHKELRRMRRRNVDLLNGRFIIERKTTKTPAGVRYVPMTPETRRARRGIACDG
jgi:integrase